MRPEVRRRVTEFVADLRRDPCYRDVLAVVVAGSAAREEERWREGHLESDIDVMVIARSSRLRIDRTRAVERVIARHAAGGLEGGRIPVGTLRYATLTNFEARHTGIVVDGDPGVLARIALERAADIPAWEGVRLLANRLFEHLRHRAGLAGAEWAVRKGYEAIGEAQLALEGRYRPSFRERASEIRRQPLTSPVERAGDLYLRAEEMRRGGRGRLDVEPARALGDLLAELEHALQRHSGRAGGLGSQLERLALDERHWLHRSYWAALGPGSRRDGLHRPTQDPIVRLWRAAVAVLSDQDGRWSADDLVRSWQACPQILRTTGSRR